MPVEEGWYNYFRNSLFKYTHMSPVDSSIPILAPLIVSDQIWNQTFVFWVMPDLVLESFDKIESRTGSHLFTPSSNPLHPLYGSSHMRERERFLGPLYLILKSTGGAMETSQSSYHQKPLPESSQYVQVLCWWLLIDYITLSFMTPSKTAEIKTYHMLSSSWRMPNAAFAWMHVLF